MRWSCRHWGRLSAGLWPAFQSITQSVPTTGVCWTALGNARWSICGHLLLSQLPAWDTKWQLIPNYTAKPIQGKTKGTGPLCLSLRWLQFVPVILMLKLDFSPCVSSLTHTLCFWSPGEQQLLFCREVKLLCFGAFSISKLQVPLEMVLCLPQAYMPYVEKCSYWKPCLWMDVNSLVVKCKAVSLPFWIPPRERRRIPTGNPLFPLDPSSRRGDVVISQGCFPLYLHQEYFLVKRLILKYSQASVWKEFFYTVHVHFFPCLL